MSKCKQSSLQGDFTLWPEAAPTPCGERSSMLPLIFRFGVAVTVIPALIGEVVGAIQLVTGVQ